MHLYNIIFANKHVGEYCERYIVSLHYEVIATVVKKQYLRIILVLIINLQHGVRLAVTLPDLLSYSSPIGLRRSDKIVFLELIPPINGKSKKLFSEVSVTLQTTFSKSE